MKITIIGTGYLGATQAACLASLGHNVLGVDIDPATVESLNAGRLPVYEPGLADLLLTGLGAGRLRFTTSWEDAADHAHVHILCVGTPQNSDAWAMDTSALDSVVDSLVPLLKGDHLLIGRSTVPVGTTAQLHNRITDLCQHLAQLSLCWSPEFLREGHGIGDTLQPDRVVLGVEDPNSPYASEAERIFRDIYGETIASTPVLVTDWQTAELTKVAANAFLATKISFINAIAEACDVAGADVLALSTALGMDERIGSGGLHPGLGFGGGCLPKDLRGFAARAEELGAEDTAMLLTAVDAVNLHQRSAVVEQARATFKGAMGDRKITVLGAAFKPGSDDIRDSPALAVAVALRREGVVVTVYDPRATENARKRCPDLNYAGSVTAALQGSELVIVATEWPEFRDLDPLWAHSLVERPVVIDGRHCLPMEQWMAAGWDYFSIGRRRPASG